MWWTIPTGIQLMTGVNEAQAQQAQYEAKAKQIEITSKYKTKQITDELNKALDYQLVASGAQGRAGGSLDIIREADIAQAEIDKSLLSAESRVQAQAMRRAGSQVANAGLLNAISGTALTSYKFSKLG